MFKLNEFMEGIIARNYGQTEFHQAVREVMESLESFLNDSPKYIEARIPERITEPERIFIFRVPWVTDEGKIQINRGFRVQMNSAIGPYKGGLRFHPSVNLGILKFLAFEQTLKNSLTTLPMGGGKGGSDFDPRGKSNSEIMRFCQSFMIELNEYIGHDIDIPAGDIGVGGREIGYLFGQYKRIKKKFTGTLTGKSISWGGSMIRPEATGFGVVYFTEAMLKRKNDSIKDKKVVISGFGNVAWGAATKASELGANVIAISGPDGYVYDKDGIKGEKIDYMLEMRTSGRDKVEDYAKKYNVPFIANKKPWELECDIALPCATQNELEKEDALQLAKNGCKVVTEGSNMSTTMEAIEVLSQNKILYSPGKASNAGGVAVSGLEMAQNSMRTAWVREEVDAKLKEIMSSIHDICVKYGQEGDDVNYVKGANIAGFIKVADAMLEQGVV